MIADTIIMEGEAIPENIILYVPPTASLAFPKGEQETTVMLWANEAQAQAGADETDIVVIRTFPGIGVGVGIYPTEGHVRIPDAYGPTGTEYVGTEVLPVETDVKLDVQYGADGIEFTGNYAGGEGLAQGTILLEPISGDRFIYLNNRLVIEV